ncbi:MAG: hypothetical protein AB8H47_01020 [Bacteroidia bacterium]
MTYLSPLHPSRGRHEIAAGKILWCCDKSQRNVGVSFLCQLGSFGEKGAAERRVNQARRDWA